MGIGAVLAVEADRNHLPGFGVVAEAGGVRHPDEFVFDDGIGDLQRLRHHGGERFRIGAIGDDEIFAVEEAIGPRRKRRVGQRHRIGGSPDIVDFHDQPRVVCLLVSIMRQRKHTCEAVKSAARRADINATKITGIMVRGGASAPPRSHESTSDILGRARRTHAQDESARLRRLSVP